MKLRPASCGRREKRPGVARSAGFEAETRAEVLLVLEGVDCVVNSGLVQ